MSGSVIKTFADERLLASNLGISFFPSYCFGVTVKGKLQIKEFSRGKLPRKNRSHLKNQVSLGKLSTSRVYLGKKFVV